MAENTDGYFSLEHQEIAICPGMSEIQTVSAVIHEMAHAMLHNKPESRDTLQEVEIFEKPALFSNGRINRDELPEGAYTHAI